MARSGGKRGVMEHHCLKRFRRRRLLAFLRRNNLPATFDALKHETRVFLDVRFLQRLVADGRWQEAREYFGRFLPCLDEVDAPTAPTALRFVTRLNVLNDLAQGKLEGIDLAEDLRSQLDAIPSTIVREDPHYAAAVRTVLYRGSHPAYWGPVDWQLIRRKAAHVVKDLVTRTPEFRHLLRLPRCPSHPCYTIPFGFGGCRRHKRKNNIGRMSASLLARRFLQKERRHSSPWTQGFSCDPMGLQEIIDETLLAGKLEVIEHSDSCSEGSPGSTANQNTGSSRSAAGESPSSVVRTSKKKLKAAPPTESHTRASSPAAAAEVLVADASSRGLQKIVTEKVDILRGIANFMFEFEESVEPDAGEAFEKKTIELEKVAFDLKMAAVNSRSRGLQKIITEKVDILRGIANFMFEFEESVDPDAGEAFEKKAIELEKVAFDLKMAAVNSRSGTSLPA